MPAPYYGMLRKAEDAIAAYAKQNAELSAILDIGTSLNLEEKQPNYLSVICPRSRPYLGEEIDARGGANHREVDVEINIRTESKHRTEGGQPNPQTAREFHDGLAGALMDIWHCGDDAINTLNRLCDPNLAFLILNLPEEAINPDGQGWISVLTFSVVVCAIDASTN